MARLTAHDRTLIPQYDAGQLVHNANSFHYSDVITHIPLQRQSHQCSSYAYRTNQMIKHAYEDGHHGYTLADMNRHTSHMNNLSDRDAFNYAQSQGWKKKY